MFNSRVRGLNMFFNCGQSRKEIMKMGDEAM
jgi:hypothetical protein